MKAYSRMKLQVLSTEKNPQKKKNTTNKWAETLLHLSLISLLTTLARKSLLLCGPLLRLKGSPSAVCTHSLKMLLTQDSSFISKAFRSILTFKVDNVDYLSVNIECFCSFKILNNEGFANKEHNANKTHCDCIFYTQHFLKLVNNIHLIS